jgi:hypothetical protein
MLSEAKAVLSEGYVGRLVACFALGAISAIAGTEPSTVTLTSSLNPSVVGQAVTLTAQVAAASLADSTSNARKGLPLPRCAGQCIPSGTVTFSDGETVIGTATLSSPYPTPGTVAILVTTHLASGVQSLSASYSGDSFYAASASAPLVQTVLTLQIATPSPLPNGFVGSPYSVTLGTNVGTGPTRGRSPTGARRHLGYY